MEAIKEHVTYARSKFEVVEFSPEDATRTELDFLLQVVQTAVNAGASYINIPDTVGFTTPEEYGTIFKYLIENVKANRQISIRLTVTMTLEWQWLIALLLSRVVQAVLKGTINGIGGASWKCCFGRNCSGPKYSPRLLPSRNQYCFK